MPSRRRCPISDPPVAPSPSIAPRHLSPARGGGHQTAHKSKFKAYPIGYFHINNAEVRAEEVKLFLFVAIDRTSKFAFTELHKKATTRVATNFLRTLLKAVPYKIHTVLTDNGTHLTTPGNQCSPASEIKAQNFIRTSSVLIAGNQGPRQSDQEQAGPAANMLC
jgi:hypothetical protein